MRGAVAIMRKSGSTPMSNSSSSSERTFNEKRPVHCFPSASKEKSPLCLFVIASPLASQRGPGRRALIGLNSGPLLRGCYGEKVLRRVGKVNGARHLEGGFGRHLVFDRDIWRIA